MRVPFYGAIVVTLARVLLAAGFVLVVLGGISSADNIAAFTIGYPLALIGLWCFSAFQLFVPPLASVLPKRWLIGTVMAEIGWAFFVLAAIGVGRSFSPGSFISIDDVIQRFTAAWALCMLWVPMPPLLIALGGLLSKSAPRWRVAVLALSCFLAHAVIFIILEFADRVEPRL